MWTHTGWEIFCTSLLCTLKTALHTTDISSNHKAGLHSDTIMNYSSSCWWQGLLEIFLKKALQLVAIETISHPADPTNIPSLLFTWSILFWFSQRCRKSCWPLATLRYSLVWKIFLCRLSWEGSLRLMLLVWDEQESNCSR